MWFINGTQSGGKMGHTCIASSFAFMVHRCNLYQYLFFQGLVGFPLFCINKMSDFTGNLHFGQC